MKEKKNIDDLVIRKGQKETELAEIHGAMRESQRQAAIVIVDFVGSTALKQKADDVDWLGLIYEFIRHIDRLVQKAGGILVKRMGDGLLLSFADVQSAEAFLDDLEKDLASANYPYKSSADFGNVFYFKFEEHLNDDPYGTVVDRCARLLEFARQGVTLCSAHFAQASSNKDRFRSAGRFALKGFTQPTEIFFRLADMAMPETKYLEPLIDTLNDKKNQRHGYHYVPRTFSVQDFKQLGDDARPFLLRELLNIPKLPLSYAQFREHIKAANNDEDLFDYYGMLVEWEACFNAYDRIAKDLIYAFFFPENHDGRHIVIHLPMFMIDVIHTFSKNKVFRFRGIIYKIDSLAIHINYADFELPEAN